MTDTDNTNNTTQIKTLENLLDLEKIEHNLYRGVSRYSPAPQVYGGQVMGQALKAAYQCVESDMIAHSAHCYFLRGGDMNNPIIYEVERTRDGRAFSSRRVIAIQHGRQIFNMSVSFQKPEEGFDHHLEAPESPDPESLHSSAELQKAFNESQGLPYQAENYPSWFFDIRTEGPGPQLNPEPREAELKIWFRLKEEFVGQIDFQQAALAYASDFRMLGAPLLPHAVPFEQKMRVATLDHAIWFHRDFDIREWLLFSIRGPNAYGGRGLGIGHIFNQQGVLVASCTQEGLIRPVYD